MTFLVLNNNTKEIIARYIGYSALDLNILNLRQEPNFAIMIHSTVNIELMKQKEGNL